MIEHIKILSYVLLLLSTLWLIFYINNTCKVHPYKFIKPIRTYIIVVLILLILRFIFYYLRQNLQQYLEPNLSPIYLKILSFAISVVTLLLVYLMLNILLSFNNKSFTASQNIKAFLIGISITAIYTLTSLFPDKISFLFNWLDFIIVNIFIFNVVINNLEFLIIILFYLSWSRKIHDTGRRKIGRSFALLYIICNSISLLFLFMLMHIEIPELFTWLIQLFVLFLFILTPFIWIRFIFIPYAQSMNEIIHTNFQVDSIYEKYDISKREQQVIELIIKGKGNNDIKEELFISYHTVKNHISNIYKKLNVKSRHELIHLFIKSK